MDCSYLPAGVIKSNHGHRKASHKIKESKFADADPENQGWGGGGVGGGALSPDLHPQDIFFIDRKTGFVYIFEICPPVPTLQPQVSFNAFAHCHLTFVLMQCRTNATSQITRNTAAH